MPWLARVQDLVRVDRLLLGGREALAAFFVASPKLTVASVAVGIFYGLLGPAFALSAGALVDALTVHSDVVLPIAVLGIVFTLQRVIDPLREEIGRALWPRVDEHLNDRIMVAVSTPVGLQELEDPAVHDRIAQAQGAVTGFTPGQAAQNSASL